ncbi:MAG: carbohydrate-binding family 9-like protein [Gemmatimonadaceae bacterium]|jgi:hypothetical protein|nr:carbohydrate-binding family 9-like protein [Gemmatimonadaceae bacterium]
MDGSTQCAAWTAAEWSPRLVDMVDGGPALYDTRVAALWDDDAFYVAFRAEEPYVRARISTRDEPVFRENDVELFIDGGDAYYELEVNALGTLYEVLFVWRDAFTRGGRFDIPSLDVHDPRTLTFAGDDDRTPATFWTGGHPRGPRWAFRGWDLPGLRSAVHVDGTLNDDRDIDRGWSVELALPWHGLEVLADLDRPVPPRAGDRWRMCFGRFQRIISSGREVQPHPAWVLTPHGRYDTHRPEQWSVVEFVA